MLTRSIATFYICFILAIGFLVYPSNNSCSTCCKYCTPGSSKPCGDSCISLSKTCKTSSGCACSGSPPTPTPTPTPIPTPTPTPTPTPIPSPVEFTIEPVSSNGGYLINNKSWIKAEIKTEEKGNINANWNTGGGAITTRGDEVIWGYFYASNTDVNWGNINNPEIFVKQWLDVGGRLDINYFHVSVPNINVSSVRDRSELLVDTVTTDTRYIRHYFEADISSGRDIKSTGNNVISQTNPFSIDKTNVFVWATIRTVEKGNIVAIYKFRGSATSNRGDRVFWGYYHADPKDVSWGNVNNPEIFVKVWYDITGRIDVNFFHVSVPDIEVCSSINNTITATTKKCSNLNLDTRYVRHEYVK